MKSNIKRTAGFAPLEILVTVAIVALLSAVMMGTARAQNQQVTSYFAQPQQPNGAATDTNDFPFVPGLTGLSMFPSSTNGLGVQVLRQNVGLSLFANYTVTNSSTVTTNGILTLYGETTDDGTANTMTGTTNGVWCSTQPHWLTWPIPYSCPPGQTNTYTAQTNIANTIASNIRDVRLEAATNSVPAPVRLNRFDYSQSWQ